MLVHLASYTNRYSDRKFNLFGCAICRQVWDKMVDIRTRSAVEVAEMYADGKVVEEDLRSADADGCVAYCDGMSGVDRDVRALGVWVASDKGIVRGTRMRQIIYHATMAGISAYMQASLLRDIFGNVFKPVVLNSKNRKSRCPICDNNMLKVSPRGSLSLYRCVDCKYVCEIFLDNWLTRDVVEIAWTIHNQKAFDRMPILGDALEDAGCISEDVLRHCRGLFLCPGCSNGEKDEKWYGGGGGWCAFCDRSGPDLHWMTADDAPLQERVNVSRPHALGCWVLGLILGK